ncbi:AcrR family transcriptional regulator [Anaerotaenia torta]|uniref:TetR/AcrR family transcriptional regulator n=1 Tax=Anaerotaenia torta TaxID=433293 RepID=UPI003D24A766
MEEASKNNASRTVNKDKRQAAGIMLKKNNSETGLNSEMGNVQNKRIMNAALDVVNKQTIAGTRMHLIAEKAKMVQSNVHYYYKTKNELMLALQDYIFEECYAARRKEKKHSKDNLSSQLDVFINQKKRLIMTKHKYDFAEVDFWVQSKIHSEIHEKFNQSYTKWKVEIREVLDRYCPWMDAKSRELLPFTFISLMEGATIQYLINKDEFDVEGYFDMCKQLMLNQIESLKPREP